MMSETTLPFENLTGVDRAQAINQHLFGEKKPLDFYVPTCGCCNGVLKSSGVFWICPSGHKWARSWKSDPEGYRYTLSENKHKWPF